MNSTATLIAVAYGVVVVVGAGVFVLLYRSTQAAGEIDEQALARRERAWLLAVAVGLTALLFATIFFTPYGESAPAGAQVVDVEARQFAFSVDPPSARVGEAVEFRLTTPDVNHGFGLYTADDELILQAQIVPDYVTTVVHTFEEPGTYKIVCMEFCGVSHHGMLGQVEVTP